MGHFTVCQPYYYNNIPKYYPGTKHAKKKNVEINLQLCVCSCKSFVEDTWVNLWDGWLYNSNTLDLTKPIYCYWNTTKWIQRKTSIFLFPPFKFLQIFIRIIFLKSSLRGNYTQHGRGTKFSIYDHKTERKLPFSTRNYVFLFLTSMIQPCCWLPGFQVFIPHHHPHKASYIWHILAPNQNYCLLRVSHLILVSTARTITSGINPQK